MYFLTEPDRKYIEEAKLDIENIIHAETVPPKLPKSKCKNCSYFDFCYSNEPEE
jgi:CRISPR-associated exonuclease Cas4